MHKLKISLIIYFILPLVNKAYSQGYLEGGFKEGLWFQTAGINSAIRDYNTQKAWLDTKLQPVVFGQGGRFVYGRQGNSYQKFGFIIDLDWLRNVQTVSGTDPATGKMTYQRLIIHYGGFGFGPMIAVVSKSHYDVQIGADFNVFNFFVIRTQENPTPDFKFNGVAKEQEAYNNYNPSVNFFARFALFAGPFGLAITPKIDLPFLGSNDVGGLAKVWGINLTRPDAHMHSFNFNLNFSIIICPSRGKD
jgi:hypothetical protein